MVLNTSLLETIVNHTTRLRDLHVAVKREEQQARQFHPKSVEEYFIHQEDDAVRPSEGTRVRGDVQLKRLRDALSSYPSRSRQQLIFQEMYTQANLKNLYGDDYEAHELRIKRENFMDELFQFAMAACPRRFGKTYGTAQWVAAWLVTQPGSNVLIFAPGMRQCQDVIKYIRQFVTEFVMDKGYNVVITRANTDEVEVRHPDGRFSKVRALPSKEETTRGATGDIILLEEAAMMKPDFVLNVVVPIAIMKRNSLLCISTLKGEGNFYSTWNDLRAEDGSKIFNSFTFYLACDECIEKGEAETCPHKAHERPAWVSLEKQTILQRIYKAMDREDLARQEITGMNVNYNQRAFDEKAIKAIFHAPLITPEQLVLPETVFVSFDPCMGGKGSDFGLCSAVFDRGTMVITGLEAVSAETEMDYMPLAVEHLLQLRRRAGFKRVGFVLLVESNLRFPAQNLVRYILDHVPFCAVKRKDGYDISSVQVGRSVGVLTAPQVKELMYVAFRNVLLGDQIRFSSEFVTVGRENPDENEEGATFRIQKALWKQLRTYNILTKFPTQPGFGNMVKSYSGKAGGMKDDLAIVAQLCNYWGRLCLQEDDYGGLLDSWNRKRKGQLPSVYPAPAGEAVHLGKRQRRF